MAEIPPLDRPRPARGGLIERTLTGLLMKAAGVTAD